jgi:hypothetical protein
MTTNRKSSASAATLCTPSTGARKELKAESGWHVQETSADRNEILVEEAEIGEPGQMLEHRPESYVVS